MPNDAGQSAKVQRGRASDRRGLGYQGRAGSSVDVVKRPRFCRTEIFLKAIGGLRARDQRMRLGFWWCVHIQEVWESCIFLGSAVLLIESSKSKTTNDPCANTKKT